MHRNHGFFTSLLGQTLVTSKTKILGRVLRICLEDGRRPEIIFPENGSPEITGDLGLNYSYAKGGD